jgi:hypothetical protein
MLNIVEIGYTGKEGDIEYENIKKKKKNGDIETVTLKNCLKVGNYDKKR